MSGKIPWGLHGAVPIGPERRLQNKTKLDVVTRNESGSFNMDQFFGSIQGCLGGAPPDTYDVEFISGYVVCTRNGQQVKILDAVLETVGEAPDPVEGYRLSISNSNPEYPVVDGITETYVELEDGFKLMESANGVKLFVALALNWAKELGL